MTPRHDATPSNAATPTATKPRSPESRRAAAPLPAQLVRVPADFVAKLRRLQSLLDRVDGVIDGLIFTLRCPDKPRVAVTTCDRPTRLRPARPPEWIEQLEASVRADGTVDVVIDDKHFDLQPHLGALFLALAEDTGSSGDDGVGFKTMADLSVRIGKRTGGHAPSRDTLNKYIHKLRHVIAERAGLPDDCIQTNRRLGRRLAVRRSAVTIW
jgi:hypothetical protein